MNMAKKKMVKMKSLPESKEGFGIVGLVLAIVSLLSVSSNGIIYAVLAVIFSKMQQKKYPNRIGRLALIIGIVGLILNVVFIILLMIYYPSILQSIQEALPTS